MGDEWEEDVNDALEWEDDEFQEQIARELEHETIEIEYDPSEPLDFYESDYFRQIMNRDD